MRPQRPPHPLCPTLVLNYENTAQMWIITEKMMSISKKRRLGQTSPPTLPTIKCANCSVLCAIFLVLINHDQTLYRRFIDYWMSLRLFKTEMLSEMSSN